WRGRFDRGYSGNRGRGGLWLLGFHRDLNFRFHFQFLFFLIRPIHAKLGFEIYVISIVGVLVVAVKRKTAMIVHGPRLLRTHGQHQHSSFSPGGKRVSG
ncbi:MAG TPA: hypothetical protein VLH09_00285, partial [Bryobacteraceae bacterium]|nr:hypothetical protein [Bryobacteraceae bacterium]